MNTFKLVFAICLGFLSSCNSKQEFNAVYKSIERDSLVPLQRTVIADLPDSLQPKIYFLKDMPKPEVIAFNESGAKTIMLPVLENDKGEPILDDAGNTILMGDGGLSNFTNFTTDDGLAMDGLNCSIIDKSGNLWFGTAGGGVSRYDGKSFTNFDFTHGLAYNIVNDILEDKAGNIWFGTGEGVSRYDGQTFTNFTTAPGLAGNPVWSILEDKAGNLWFGTWGGGVIRYDPSASLNTGSKSFTNFTTDQGLVHDNIVIIKEDKSGKLWFGSFGGGVSCYDPSATLRTGSISFTNFTTAQGLAHNDVLSITEDKTGKLWFGTGDGGVSVYDLSKSPEKEQEVFMNLTKNHELANSVVTGIIEDNYVPAGEVGIWLGTTRRGVSYFDGRYFKNFTTAQGLANNFVMSITKDKIGNLWISTMGGGVSRYDGKSFTNFTKVQGLSDNSVWTIMEDKTGNLWFGTSVGSVSRFDGKSFVNITSDDGLAKYSVDCILEDKTGNLWFGGTGGLSKYDGKSFTNFNTAHGLKDYVFNLVEDNSGNIWFDSSEGVSRFDGNSFTNFTTDQGLANNNVFIITEDNTGNLWIGTNGGGISRYDGKTFTNFTTSHGLPNNYIKSIEEDKSGNFWIGTDDGLGFLESQTARELFIELTAEDLANQLNSENQQDQFPNLGPGRLSEKSSTLFRSFGKADGLADKGVTQVVQLPNGKMAAGTNLGITVFNISEDHTTLTDLEIFNSFTGYPIKDVNSGQNAMFLDSRGIIWAGTGSDKTGLVRFDYEALKRSEELPVLVIESVKVKDEAVSWHTLAEAFENDQNSNSNQKTEKINSQDSITVPAYITEEASLFGRKLRSTERDSMIQRFKNIEFDSITPFYPLPQNLVLPYSLNQVSFEFVAIETSRPQMIKYQYQLEGYDEDWSPVTNRSNASFGNIHEGSYTFKVKALDANGMWTEPVSYSFTVLPPWYRSWWAYGIYALFLIGLVWRIHLIQKARTLRIEREKTKDRELAQAKEIENAYGELGKAHQTLKSTQAQLIQSEKMVSLGELTAGIAHEIQNPLNFVNNFSEVSAELMEELKSERLKVEGERSEIVEEEIIGDVIQNLEKINHHGKRADAIVKGMLEHSRISSGEKVPTDINALADEYLRLSYHGMRAKDKSFNAEFVTDFDPNLPKINVVPQEIGRVLLNIINNAFQAISQPSKGSKPLEGFNPLVTVFTKNLGDKIEISVRDNGPGIPDSIKSKIFQPFFTTKPTGQGTGLGLSLSYDIVKAHGGELKVESNFGEGLPVGVAFTKFTIILPL
ncbi:ATP-binding protein [Aquiflexum sp. TKW24L]|uniref:two-component regulator propeller domain-containing protein n=1 Tax=Aquiflexum sp. TKW24L TaxID=2942212 RepID=UPI0020C0E77B|nr:two-component regulator propeller domain-containing protein [Aquiflexum sp. TKW24L]MCL6257626.1 ATP-binding protein [Aquiflexum sp. TKW24L]